MGGATFSDYKTYIAGETLTASDLNSSHMNILNNFNFAGIDDYSATATEMRVVTDPYPASVESLATSGQGELERLRFLIKQITNEAQWYIDPDNSLSNTSKPTYAGLTSTGAIDEAYATVASHATTAPIWAALGNLINYTGTEVATAFPNAPQAGARRTLICAAACGFTAGANMLINGIASASTYTAAAGDRVEVEALSTTQFKLTITKYDGTALVSSAGITTRQTVSSGAIDSNGYANYISAGTGLAVNIAATSVPVILTAANGFNSNGNVDRKGSISADTSISSLTASNTNYLYADIAADGSVTLGKTILQPVYQFGGTYSTTNGQFTFNIQEMVGKVGNGSSAVQTYRVFIGEAVTDGSTVTSVKTYALQRRFRGANAACPAQYSAASWTHALGVTPDICKAYAVCVSANNGYAVGDVAEIETGFNTGAYQDHFAPYRYNRLYAHVFFNNSTFILDWDTNNAALDITSSANFNIFVVVGTIW